VINEKLVLKICRLDAPAQSTIVEMPIIILKNIWEFRKPLTVLIVQRVAPVRIA
jgi:hypothetical protein